MQNFKKFFPIFEEHSELIYLDNAASAQKPIQVIEGVNTFVRTSYANIHRGMYSLSEHAEETYHQSKILVSEFINSGAPEIIYSYNATYAINLIAQSLVHSKLLKKWDIVWVGIWDHHATILPRMSLAKDIWFEVKFIPIKEDHTIDWDFFEDHYTDRVKVIACSQVSNVTGVVYDMKKITSYLDDGTFFLVDASQSAPSMRLDFSDLGCDAMVFTGHKMMAYTGIGILALKSEWIKRLDPLIVGWGTVVDVSIEGYQLATRNEKFEAGTPNIIGAASLYYALSFIQSLAESPSLSRSEQLKKGIEKIHQREMELANLGMQEFKKLWEWVSVLGPLEWERLPIFSFILKNLKNFNQIGEFFASKNIAIRCGGHCAYPLHKYFQFGGTCRMSAYFYNDSRDIGLFFAELKELIQTIS